MSIDLNKCDKLCFKCVSSYASKHHLGKGDSFKIACKGIPTQYLSDEVLATLGDDPKVAISIYDPITWAAEYLDWHCLDPDGEVWKRKTTEGTLGSVDPFDPADPVHLELIKTGKSPYHRPYQAEMIRCSSRLKVFRCGRQIGKSESLCISILYNIFTRNNFFVEVIAPYQSQVDLIFGRLSEYIDRNPALKNSVVRNTRAPAFNIELSNHSEVVGFTAGTRSGQNAGSSKGQHANMLVFDEADMLASLDIDAALPVIINHPNATVWMSSTPTGKRERFYEVCKDPIWREFHFPSQINPTWSEFNEHLFTNQLTAAGYKHEVFADFGEQEEGVYQLKYIEAAQAEYEYDKMTARGDWLYTIGVDWNDVKVGTTIAVIGYNPAKDIFSLVHKEIISRIDATQLTACNKIAEMNRLWKPIAIYVDNGYGATQIEVLHAFGKKSLQQFGANHPDSKLRDIVKPYDFGGNQEIRDPFTGELVQKPAKPFLVENSVRRFESLQFQYPRSDVNFTNQLIGYIISRVSITGRPVYEQRNVKVGDHLLDAVNLALIAFTLEKSMFGKPNYLVEVKFAPSFGSSENNREPARVFDQEADEHKPPMGNRAAPIEEKSVVKQTVPGKHESQEAKTKLWDWPGWSHDAPAPSVKRDNSSNARRLFGNHTRQFRPKRAKW